MCTCVAGSIAYEPLSAGVLVLAMVSEPASNACACCASVGAGGAGGAEKVHAPATSVAAQPGATPGVP
jgi:hypothetical protein